MSDVGERWGLDGVWTGTFEWRWRMEGGGWVWGTGTGSYGCSWGQTSSSNSRMLPCQTAPVTTPSAAAALAAIPLKNSTSCSGTEGNNRNGGYHQEKLVVISELCIRNF